MSDLPLRRRVAALVLMAFLSVMGATVAADSEAQSWRRSWSFQEQRCIAGNPRAEDRKRKEV